MARCTDPRGPISWLRLAAALLLSTTVLMGCEGVVNFTRTAFDRDMERYRKRTDYKAVAVAYDDVDGDWVWGMAWGHSNMRGAIEQAGSYCADAAREGAITNLCRVHTIGDEMVLDYTKDAMKQLLMRYQSAQGSP